jgi:hypothetical protein
VHGYIHSVPETGLWQAEDLDTMTGIRDTTKSPSHPFHHLPIRFIHGRAWSLTNAAIAALLSTMTGNNPSLCSFMAMTKPV